MKKRFVSLILALCMIIGLLPVTTISAAAADAKYYTVEQYDADGNGTMLVPPTETTNWSGRYGTSFITSLLGSGNVTMSDDAVTGIKVGDTWLNNDGASKWYIATNYNKEVYLDSSYFYASDADVLRFIYVPNGDISKAGMTTEGADWADACMKVEKGDLIKTLATYGEVTPGGNRAAAFNEGIAAVLNINATADDVAAAKTKMDNAEDAAGSVELNKESTTLYVGQKETLTATLEPAGSTDELIWTSSNDSIVAVKDGVLKGMSAGTATVTVEAEDTGLTDSIEVTVNALQGLFITKLNSNASATIEAEKESLLLAAFAEPEGIENLDWQWSVEDPSIAKVVPMEGNEYMAEVTGKAEGTTNVVVALGSMTSIFEVTVTPYQGPYVYFDFDDETKEDLRLDENNSITLTSLDAGNFKVANTGGSVTWNCKGYVTIYHPDYGDVQQYHTWINSETGRWASSGTQPPTATVDTSDGFTQTFTIVDQNLSNITELKIYVNGAEVSNENPFVMTGTGRANVRTDGLMDGEWITIPQQALEYTTSDTAGNIRILGNELILNRAGEATLTATVLGSNVSASFKARCEYVPVKSMEVIVPETAYMHDYNTYTGCFVGLLPDTGFQVKFTPENATNRDYNIEALTPDVAIYWKEHNNGIVPKKPGTARFKVSSADNADIYQEISINFEYKNKLTAATCEDFTMKAGTKQGLAINTTPGNASEQRFNWTCEPSGIVGVESKIATDVGGTSHWFEHTISAWSTGTVKVTGTPVDQTGGCEPIQFTVTVTENGEPAPEVDHLALAKEDIAHGLKYLSKQSMDEFGDEWTIFTILRAGGTVSQADQIAYCASVKAKLDSGAALATNDYVRLVLTLGVMGKDPTNFEGYNLVERIYNTDKVLTSQPSNQLCWALIALDSKDYTIPADAKWTREMLIEQLLKFQIAKGDNAGAFDLNVGGTEGSVDMTGMIMQSLAPYNTDDYPEVQAAFEKAQTYLKNKMTLNAGYVEGGSENSCTAAQPVVALCAAGIDPVDAANGYTKGTSNLITNLHTFRVADGGFKTWAAVDEADLLGTYQTTYALEAYRRFAENENRLYYLTDVPVYTDPRTELSNLLNKAKALTESDYTAESWANLKTAMSAAEEILNKENATGEELGNASNALSQAIAGLKKPSSGSGGTESKQISVTFRLVGSEKAGQDVDMEANPDNIPKYVTWIKTTTYKVDEDAKVYDVFTNALDEAGLSQEGADKNYVRWITAPNALGGYRLGEFTNGPYSGWMYTVNGIHVNKGLTEQTLKNGDAIVWHYVNDYRFEIEDWYGGSPLGNENTFSKWLDAPDVNPTSNSGGSSGGGSSSNTTSTAEDQEAADKVADLITSIGAVTEDSGEKITAAREAYNKLTDAQKKLVSNYSRLTAAEQAYAKLTGKLPFTDVTGHWAEEAIQYAYQNGLFAGTSDTTFGPNISMNRAMLVTVLYRMENQPSVTGTNSFADVAADTWYTKAVTWAAANNIVSGYSADKFGPTDTITREQMASILNRYAKFKGYDVNATTDLAAFTDANTISDWALASMKWANAEKLINGRTSETLAPKGNATRAEVAQILMTFAQNVAK